jgi:hypothetical protein
LQFPFFLNLLARGAKTSREIKVFIERRAIGETVLELIGQANKEA